MYAANGTSIGTCGDQDPPPRPRPPTDVPTEIHRRRCHVKIVTKIKEKKEFGSPHSYTLFYKDFGTAFKCYKSGEFVKTKKVSSFERLIYTVFDNEVGQSFTG